MVYGMTTGHLLMMANKPHRQQASETPSGIRMEWLSLPIYHVIRFSGVLRSLAPYFSMLAAGGIYSKQINVAVGE